MSKTLIEIAKVSQLEEKKSAYTLVSNTDLVIIKHEKGIKYLLNKMPPSGRHFIFRTMVRS